MSAGRPSLPEYAHPPLVAATLAVYFNETIDVTSSMRTEYQRPLGPEWAGQWTKTPTDVDPDTFAGYVAAGWRLQNMLGDRVIRVSPVHFEFTWLGTEDTRYPRYENVRDGFVAAWDLLADQQKFGSHHVGSWAVVYLNRIRQGTVWQSPADWRFFQLMPDAPRLAERMSSARWFLKTAEDLDPLRIDWSFKPNEATAESSVWLRLMAHGDIGPERLALLDGMDSGRAAIVHNFSDLLSPAANAYWGLRRREK